MTHPQDSVVAALEVLGLDWCPDCAAEGRSGFYHLQRDDECTHPERELTAAELAQRRERVQAVLEQLTPAMAAAATHYLVDRPRTQGIVYREGDDDTDAT